MASYQGKEMRQMGSAMLQERRMKNRSAKSMLWSADRDWETSKITEECQKDGGGHECGMK